MRKLIIVIIFSLLLISCNKEVCESDIAIVCTVNNIEDFELEENASIVIGVFEETFGEALIEKLDVIYPGVYSYAIIDEDEVENISDYDIIQTKVENVPLLFEYISPLDDSFTQLLENDYLNRFSKEVNQVENYFMPFDVKGLLFAYNKTMLAELGVNLSDTNADGLPEAIESFEKIGALASKLKASEATYLDEPLEKMFSFPFNDQLSMISFIENSEYRLISGVSGEKMNVGDDLVNALDNVVKLGNYPWYFDSEQTALMAWDYEEVLETQSAPFLLVGSWMFYEQYQSSQAYELAFSKLPQINESDITTLSSVSGFVLNKDSEFPLAQNQFIKFIKDIDGVALTIESGIIPIVDPEILMALDMEVDNIISQQIIAYTYSSPIQLQAFEENPSIRAYDVYYDVDFRDIWKDLFLNKIDAKSGQKLMIERIDEWLEVRQLEIEGVEDEQVGDDNKSPEE